MGLSKQYGFDSGYFDQSELPEQYEEPMEQWEIVGAPTPFENDYGKPLDAMDEPDLSPSVVIIETRLPF